MRNARLTLGAVALMLMSLPFVLSYCSVSHAQQGQCGPMDDTDANLLKRYNEAISGAGIGESDRDAWEVTVSPDGETFTIVRLFLDLKTACVVGSGHHWAQIPVPSFQEPKQKL